MCGIFAAITTKETCEFLQTQFNRIQHRGPDSSNFVQVNKRVHLGFHRLAINDLSDAGMQPFYLNGVWLICNGEIFNYSDLKKKYKFETTFSSNSDCEVLLHIYIHLGGGQEAIDKIVRMINAEYALIIYDSNTLELFAARDETGIRPLFYSIDQQECYFASEAKALQFCDTVSPFQPGSYSSININLDDYNEENVKWRKLPTTSLDPGLDEIHLNINKLLTRSVSTRCLSDTPVGAFLSGGLDSSIVSALLVKFIPDLVCFSIGLNESSPDIIAAKQVADFIGIKPTNHHCIYFTAEEGFNAISTVIFHLETFDITTIRAGIANWLMARYISEHTDIKVLFSGSISDEIFNGYQYGKNINLEKTIIQDSTRLLSELHLFDNLRDDRCAAAHGLEIRVPFGSRELVDYIFSIPARHRFSYNQEMEKMLLRDSFKGLLPKHILYRRKEAFSDAVSSEEQSWYKTLQVLIEPIISDYELENASKNFPHNTPKTKEALYYRLIFNELFPGKYNLTTHYWLPKFCNETTEPSATILDCYLAK